jgi:hypothetical protein
MFENAHTNKHGFHGGGGGDVLITWVFIAQQKIKFCVQLFLAIAVGRLSLLLAIA